jgi:hypothetical protein
LISNAGAASRRPSLCLGSFDRNPVCFALARGRSTDRRISPPPRCSPRAPPFLAVRRCAVKSRISKPPVDAGLFECARLLGARLGIPLPLHVMGKEMTDWWAEVGKALAEQQPEFRRRGRPPGSKTKNLNPAPMRETERKRRSRLKQQARALTKRQLRDGWLLIGDKTYLVPEEVLASIEPFLIRRDGNSS